MSGTGAHSTVWGCLECGRLAETLNERTRCPFCQVGLVTELGGGPSSQKAQALIAYARREATDEVENLGTFIGATLGLVLGSAFATLIADGMVKILVALYGGVLGGMVLRCSAIDLHRRLRPTRRWQPAFDPAARRNLLWATLGWALLGVGIMLLAGGANMSLKRLAGELWAMVGGMTGGASGE